MVSTVVLDIIVQSDVSSQVSYNRPKCLVLIFSFYFLCLNLLTKYIRNSNVGLLVNCCGANFLWEYGRPKGGKGGGVYTPWVKKRETPYSSSHLRQIFTDFKNSFTATICRKFAIKPPLKIPPHPLHYLVKYKFSKSHRLQSQRQIMRAHTKE